LDTKIPKACEAGAKSAGFERLRVSPHFYRISTNDERDVEMLRLALK
jgi:hypothetical protein